MLNVLTRRFFGLMGAAFGGLAAWQLQSRACACSLLSCVAAIAGRWGSKLSQKLFVGKEYVVKHIRLKHTHVIDAEREKVRVPPPLPPRGGIYQAAISHVPPPAQVCLKRNYLLKYTFLTFGVIFTFLVV